MKRQPWCVVVLVVGAVLVLAMIRPGFAQVGGLDPTFGSSGKVTTAIGSVYDTINNLALQPDGKIVAGGQSKREDSPYNTNFWRGALVRYNPDGSLDTSFGSGGKVTQSVANKTDYIGGVAIQSDGKILAAGSTDYEYGQPIYGTLARYNANGSLDTSFGTAGTGIIVINWSGSTEYGGLRAVVIQPDGKILTGGGAQIGANPAFLGLLRFNADGTPDTSFGQGTAKVITQIYATANPPIGFNMIGALALQPDGKIVAGSYAYDGTYVNPVLVRYNTDGSLDTTFGQGGKIVTPLGYHNRIFAIALQSDGKIVAPTGYGPYMNVFRYNANGSPDTSFGAGGVVNVANAQGFGVALQPDGKIVVGGVNNLTSTEYHFSLWRLNVDGARDQNFGTGGNVTTTMVSGTNDQGRALLRLPDGRLVLGGTAANVKSGGSADVGLGVFALARYIALKSKAIPPTGFGLTNAGDPDPNWTVNGKPAQLLTPSAANWYGGWLANGPNSNWIGVTASNPSNGPAPYTFQVQFNLSSFNFSTVSLSGQWSVDDAGALKVNGHQIASLSGGNWGRLNPFALAAGSGYLNQGLNTLEITMTQTDNYLEGVRLEGVIVDNGSLPIINYPTFIDLSGFTLNGDAVTAPAEGKLRLTTAEYNKRGSAFLTQPISLGTKTSFSSAFSFQMSNPGGISDPDGIGADGLVFVIQAQGPTALGDGGGYLGYSGITPSLEVEFDTYQNGWDAGNGNHVGINTNGNVTSVALSPQTQRLNDGNPCYAWVDYLGASKMLEVRFSRSTVRPGLPTLSYEVDLPALLGANPVWVGFTAATASACETHDLISWTLTTSTRQSGGMSGFILPLLLD
jgi:uncharacterized delta-60 repeat protein